MKPFRPQTKQYWRVVLLCFVAASTFWLLNALNKSYSTQTTYPIRFIYNEQQVVPIKPLPDEVIVNVTAKGWKLLRKTLRLEVQPAEIYIRNVPRTNYMLGSALRPALVNAMDGLELKFVVTDTLYFDFDSRISRTVPLKVDPRQKIAANGFEVSGPVKLTPSAITFEGPSSIVNKIPNPYLLRLPKTGINSLTTIDVPIAFNGQEQIKANITETKATVAVKPLVQEERQLTPEIVNAPRGKTLSIQPAVVQVRYQLFEDSAALLNRESFKAIINFDNYNSQDSTVILELVQKPTGVRNVILKPQRVKVLLSK